MAVDWTYLRIATHQTQNYVLTSQLKIYWTSKRDGLWSRDQIK